MELHQVLLMLIMNPQSAAHAIMRALRSSLIPSKFFEAPLYQQDACCVGAGRLVMATSIIDPEHEQRWSEYVSKHRCDSQSRGSVYDSKAGASILAALTWSNEIV